MLPTYRGNMVDRRAALLVWGFLAIVNLSAAIVIASWPDRRADLDTMRGWGTEWLLRGRNVYAVEKAWPEYPPHAIVMLSPLAALPDKWAAPLWAGFNIFLAVFVSRLVILAHQPRMDLSTALLPVLMFLCWGGFRALLQFSLLSLMFALLSMTLADRRPIWSGICLGLGLMKPQMSIPFFLWALLTRRFRMLAIAMSVVAAGFPVYCLKVQTTPAHVAADYLAIVNRYYVGDAIMYGLAQPRPFFEMVTSDTEIVDAAVVTVAVLTLMIVCGTWFAETGRHPRSRYAAPALAGLWSLLTFYHLTYGFLVLLPLAVLLLFENEPANRVFRQRLFWALQLTMMFDVTVFWRWFEHLLLLPAVTGSVLIHADRVIMLGLFVCVVILAVRAPGRACQAETAL
jgi:Glycosyltransferase family 87